MSLRPEFSRSLRHLPVVTAGQLGRAANELQGLIQDLSVRLIGTAAQSYTALSNQLTLLGRNIRQKCVWHHRGQTAATDEGRVAAPQQANRTLFSALSTQNLESLVMPPVRDSVIDALRQVAPSPHHQPIAQDGPAQHEQTVRVAELMAMELAYQRPADAASIDLPLGREHSLVRYQVEIVPIAMGLQAYGFMPAQGSDAPPVLLFRGTVTSPVQRAAGTTWVADLDPLGVGWAVFQFGQSEIQRWLEKAHRQTGQKALAIGHSMGGAHATYAGVYHPTLVDKVLAFNPPAVSFLAKKRWQQLQSREEGPAIWNFINTRDDISYLGQEVVGQDYFVHVSPEVAAGPAFRCDRKLFGLFEWSGHTHHSKRMMIHPHIALAGQRSLTRWRYAFSVIAVVPFLLLYSLLLIKRLLVGHQSASRYSYLLGWIAVILAALATVAIQAAVLSKLGINHFVR